MTLVLDASVILKWLLADPERESETKRATSVVQSVVSGQAEILQPSHWLIEVAAVLTRLSPQSAVEDALMLQAMEIPVTDEVTVLRRACTLAIETQHHLFDTLYHAVALETEDTVLITADEAYYRKARTHGRILTLGDWSPEA